MAAHIPQPAAFRGASASLSWTTPWLQRFAGIAKKTGIASGLVALGAALHVAWHVLPFFQAAAAGGLVLACHS